MVGVAIERHDAAPTGRWQIRGCLYKRHLERKAHGKPTGKPPFDSIWADANMGIESP